MPSVINNIAALFALFRAGDDIADELVLAASWTCVLFSFTHGTAPYWSFLISCGRQWAVSRGSYNGSRRALAQEYASIMHIILNLETRPSCRADAFFLTG